MKNNIQKVSLPKGEKYNKVVDAWAKCSDSVADEMMKILYQKKLKKLKISIQFI